MKYKTITESMSKDFDIRINELLSNGWVLYGNPYLAFSGKHVMFCQALTKKGE